MSKKSRVPERKYWIIPERVFPGSMSIKNFLKKAGYIIKDGVYGVNVKAFEQEPPLGIIYDGGNVRLHYLKLYDLNYLDHAMDLIEILSVNNVPFEEWHSREDVEKEVRRITSGLIKRLKKTPKE